MDKTTLGDRMKNNYEVRTRQYLTRRTPTIIRLDGKAFHTYTKGLDRPFDEGLMEDMAETTRFLCQEIQGVKCGYTQSDEITLLLTDFDTFGTQAWFDYQVQKIVSISASMATAKFNQLRQDRFATQKGGFMRPPGLAYFDARVFQISEFEEVVNCFIWRQRDAIKNSIQMLAQSLFSQRDLHKKNGTEQRALCAKVGYPWEDLSIDKQRGSFVTKNLYVNDKLLHFYRDSQWCSDKNEDTSIGDLWFQTDVESYNFPDKRGRLLEWGVISDRFVDNDGKHIDGEDWYEVPIKSIRTKWEIVECPDFTEDRNSILKLLNSKHKANV